MDGNDRIYVIYDTARIRGKHGGVDLSSGDSLYELTLAALGVLGTYDLYSDPVLVFNKLADMLYGLGLVVLYGDDALSVVKKL